MSKVLSIAEFPIVIVSGILGQKVASTLWTRVAGEAPPDTAQEHPRWALMLPAAVVEGTFYKLFRMGAERGLRLAVARSTGSWVGQTGQGE